MKERENHIDGKADVIFKGAKEQERTDARSLARRPGNSRQFRITVFPLLHQQCRQSGGEAEYKA